MSNGINRRDALKLSVVTACTMAIGSNKLIAGSSHTENADLYRTKSESELLVAAKAIATLDVHGIFTTVDSNGAPRSRTMSFNLLEEEMTIWMSTRHNSRKLEQIEGNKRSTLYFPDSEQWGYASFMGSSFIHKDVETVKKQSFFYEELRDRLFPKFPDDMVMIEFKPEILEVAGRGISVSKETWQPQGMKI